MFIFRYMLICLEDNSHVRVWHVRCSTEQQTYNVRNSVYFDIQSCKNLCSIFPGVTRIRGFEDRTRQGYGQNSTAATQVF